MSQVIDRQVGQSSDDCARSTDGLWNLAAADFLAGNSVGARWWASGARFTNITIPKGAIITTAYLTLRAKSSIATTTVNTELGSEQVDNPATFIDNAAVFDARLANQGAVVSWNSIAAWTINNDYQSPDIKAVIQELVNRAGWISGNSMVIFWSDWAGNSNVGAYRSSYSWDSSAANCAKLHIEYYAQATRSSFMSAKLIAGKLI